MCTAFLMFLSARKKLTSLKPRPDARLSRFVRAARENPYLDNPPAETPLSENQGQYNTYNSIQKNQLLSDKSSIIPAAAKPTFNISGVEKSAERVTDGYNAEEVEYYTEVIRENLDYWHLGDWLCQDGRVMQKQMKSLALSLMRYVHLCPIPRSEVQHSPEPLFSQRCLKPISTWSKVSLKKWL